jgi:hypothetical protein
MRAAVVSSALTGPPVVPRNRPDCRPPQPARLLNWRCR